MDKREPTSSQISAVSVTKLVMNGQLVQICCPSGSSPELIDPVENSSREVGHGSNAGHSSGVAQGQRSLNRCSGRDFQHEVFAPTATAAFHSQTVAAGMLLQQRPTRRVLSCATAKLLRDEAGSMVPNIDPEQVRKLAGWGLTQDDMASFVGWSQSLISLGFQSIYALKASGN